MYCSRGSRPGIGRVKKPFSHAIKSYCTITKGPSDARFRPMCDSEFRFRFQINSKVRFQFRFHFILIFLIPIPIPIPAKIGIIPESILILEPESCITERVTI